MSQGKKLLASTGREYDYFLAGMDAAQRLVHQKKSLTARLGLGGAYAEDDLINEGDFKNQRETVSPGPGLRRINTAVERSNSVYSAAGSMGSPYDSIMQTPTDETGLSKRQLNMLKRKKKMDLKFHANKVHVVDLADRRLSMTGTRTPHISEPAKRKNSETIQLLTASATFHLIGRMVMTTPRWWQSSKSLLHRENRICNLKLRKKEWNGLMKGFANISWLTCSTTTGRFATEQPWGFEK